MADSQEKKLDLAQILSESEASNESGEEKKKRKESNIEDSPQRQRTISSTKVKDSTPSKFSRPSILQGYTNQKRKTILKGKVDNDDIQTLQDENAQLKKNISRLQQKIIEFEQTMNRSEMEKTHINKLLEEKDKKLQTQNRQIYELEHKILEVQDYHQSQHEELLNNIEAGKTLVQQLKVTDMDNIQKSEQSPRTFDDSSKDGLDSYRMTQQDNTQLDALQLKYDQLKVILKDTQNQNRILELEKSEQEKKHRRVEEELSQLSQLNFEINLKLTENGYELESLSKQNDQLRAQNLFLSTEQHHQQLTIQKQNKRHTLQQEDLQERIKQSFQSDPTETQRLQKLIQQQEKLNSFEKKQLNEQIIKLEQELLESYKMQQGYKEMEQANERLTNELELANGQILMLQADYDHQQKQQQLQTKRHTLNQEDLIKSFQQVNLSESKDNNQEDIDKLEKKFMQQQKVFDYEKRQLEDKIKILEKDINEILGKPDYENIVQASFEEEKQQIKKQLEDAESKNILMKTEMDQINNNMRQQVRRHTMNQEELFNQLREHQLSAAKENEELENRVQRFEKLSQRLEQIHEKEKMKLITQIEFMESEILRLSQSNVQEQLESKIKDLESSLQEAQTQNLMLHDEIDQFKKSLYTQTKRNTLNQEDLLNKLRQIQDQGANQNEKDAATDAGELQKRLVSQQKVFDYEKRQLEEKIKRQEDDINELLGNPEFGNRVQSAFDEEKEQIKKQLDEAESNNILMKTEMDLITNNMKQQVRRHTLNQEELFNQLREHQLSAAKENEELEKRVQRFEKLAQKLEEVHQRERIKLQEQIEFMEGEILRLSDKQVSEQQEERIKELETQLQEAQTQNLMLHNDIDQFKKTLHTQTKRNTLNQEDLLNKMRAIQEQADKAKEIDLYQQQISSLENELSQLRERQGNSENQIENEIQNSYQLEDLKNQVISLQDELSKEQQRNKILQKDFSEFTKDQLRKEQDQASLSITLQMDEIQKNWNENITVNKLDDERQTIIELNERIQTLIENNQVLHSELQKERLKNVINSNRNGDSSEENREKYQQNLDHQLEQNISQQIIAKDEIIQKLSEQIIVLHEFEQTKISQQTQELAEFQQLCVDLTQTLEQYKVKVVYLEDEKNALMSNMQLQESAMGQFKAKLESEIYEYEDKISNLQQQLIRDKNQMRDQFNMQLINLQTDLRNKDLNNHNLISQMNQYKRQIESLKYKLNIQNRYVTMPSKSPTTQKYEKYDKLQNDIQQIKQSQDLLYEKLNSEANNIAKTVSSISPQPREYQYTQNYNQTYIPGNYSLNRNPVFPQQQLRTTTHPIKQNVELQQKQQKQGVINLDEMYQSCIEQSKKLLQKHQPLLNSLLDQSQVQESQERVQQDLQRYQGFRSISPIDVRGNISGITQDFTASQFHNSPIPQQLIMNSNQKPQLPEYEGDTLGIMRHGKGRQNYPDDQVIYEGEWKFDRRHGEGMLMTELRKIIYEGSWECDSFSGLGTLVNLSDRVNDSATEFDFNNWSTYEGEFQNNVFRGKGILVLDNGDSFEGEFVNNLPDGQGRYIFRDGRIVVGFWQDGLLLQQL